MAAPAVADPRYPVGKFEFPQQVTAADRARWLDELAALPAKFRAALAGLSEQQLDTPYREGGWTVRQVAHHLADSHLNAYTRVKLALTEDTPTIKPYDQEAWAKLPDTQRTPLAVSLTLLEALHARLVTLLRALTPEEMQRRFRHPELGTTISIEQLLAMYAWHGRHHSGHVTELRKRMGW